MNAPPVHATTVWAVAATVIVLGAAIFAATVHLSASRHRRRTADARWVRIAAPPEVEASSAAALWTTLAGVLLPSRRERLLHGTAHVAWEYTWAARTLSIRIWVPGTVPPGAVESAVRAAWPGSTLTTEPAGPPIPPTVTHEAGGALWPQDSELLPLRTDHDADPLRVLMAAGASTRTREHACVQILARPATSRHVRAARRAAHHRLTDSGPAAAGIAGAGAGLAATLLTAPLLALLQALLPGRHSTTTGQRGGRTTSVGRDPLAEVSRRAVVEKVTGVPHWEIGVRYAVAATTPAPAGPAGDLRRAQTTDRLRGLAHTLASATATYTRPNRLRRIRMNAPVAVLADRRLRRGFLATVEELAVLAALPLDVAVPGLDRARAKAMPAPVAVASGGRQVKVLGRSQIGGHAVGLQVTDARQHVHLVGKTGVGKSTLLLNMILTDIHAHRGTIVIDPRGDLVTDILDRLPLEYADRIAIIDPDQTNPACFNPLDTGNNPIGGTGDAHLAVDNLVGIFAKIFQRHWGPRIDDTLRVSCLTLMRHPRPTLALVPPLLNDRTFRARFTVGLTDPEGLGGFWQWYDSMNDGLRAQVIGPVLARLRAFLLRDFVKDVIGTPHSSFQMSRILDGGILLCRLPKGLLGEETARILGSLIVARVWQAAIARAGQPENTRKDAALYIDECHNFLTLPGSVDDMLAEARGFRLGLVLAHQNLTQLPRETQAALSANARSKIYFTVEPGDAKDLSRHTLPEIDDHDLSHLDVYTASARLLVGNRELPAFTFTTNPPSDPLGHATAIRDACARTHARTDPPNPQPAPTPQPATPATSARERRPPRPDHPRPPDQPRRA